MNHVCVSPAPALGVLRRGPDPTRSPWANAWLLGCAPLCPDQEVPKEAVPG